MGLAASQARLISLTARMSDLEYEGQQINQQRQVLTNKMTEVYNKAMEMEVPTPPSKIDFALESYTGKRGTNSVEITRDKNGNWYGTQQTVGWTAPATGSTVVEVSYPEGKEFDKNSAEFKALLASGAISPLTDDGGCSGNDYAVEGNKVTLNIPVKYSTVKEGDKELGTPKAYSEGDSETKTEAFQHALQGLENQITPDLKKDGESFDTSLVSYIKVGEGEYKLFYDFNSAAGAKNSVYTPEYGDAKAPIENIREQLDAGGNIKGFIYDFDGKKDIKVDVTVSGAAYDEVKYDAKMREYELAKIEYDKEQNEFNKQTSIYQRQDKQLELKLTRLDNERNALNTEIESVKKVIQDASEKGFKTFSG